MTRKTSVSLSDLQILRESKKWYQPNYGYKFVSSRSIRKIFSLLQGAVIFQQNPCWVTYGRAKNI